MISIDVIVPCYKYGNFLRECVESILGQTGLMIRVLIIDDASPDNTADVASELAQKDSRVTLLRHHVNRGHIATYNEGIDWVQADYLLLLSADDYLLPGALNRAVLLMARHPEVGFTFGNAVELSEGLEVTTNALPCNDDSCIISGKQFIAHSGVRNIVPTPTAIIRTELQKRVGGYRPELPHAGDFEMWFRLAAHASVGFISAPLAVYRRHASNMSLSFTTQCWLPDLEQRDAALDCFFETSGPMVPQAEDLKQSLRDLLAREAVGRASTAFNNNEMLVSEQLTSFAQRISPGIRRSLPWAKLACKRVVGLTGWRAIKSSWVFIGRVPKLFSFGDQLTEQKTSQNR